MIKEASGNHLGKQWRIDEHGNNVVSSDIYILLPDCVGWYNVIFVK